MYRYSFGTTLPQYSSRQVARHPTSTREMPESKTQPFATMSRQDLQTFPCAVLYDLEKTTALPTPISSIALSLPPSLHVPEPFPKSSKRPESEHSSPQVYDPPWRPALKPPLSHIDRHVPELSLPRDLTSLPSLSPPSPCLYYPLAQDFDASRTLDPDSPSLSQVVDLV